LFAASEPQRRMDYWV